MKRLFLFAAFVGLIIATYYLYQRQLGAIGFLILSVFFFSLAWNQRFKYAYREKENRIGRKYWRIANKKELGKK
ncbi:hypothetical protein [Bacillus massilinigeriensis]|uniref:hypothetical protein n=1 Tax=Bacillus massilionigeriensis TaxID=1805475 RepID=UPI00096B4629|nr:hypothetical protein [Bacillus massilionigeriensis]